MFDWYGRPNKLDLIKDLAVNARNGYFALNIPLSEFGKAGTEGTMAHQDGGFLITTRHKNYWSANDKTITQATLVQIAHILGVEPPEPITTILVCSPSEDAGLKPTP